MPNSPKALPISSKFLVTLSVLCLFGLHWYLRSPALNLDYFHNEDTAGITYSADLILRGGSPLIDTVEMKAPGSFFLLAGWWSLFGRSIESAQFLMLLWSALAALGVGLGAWLIYRSLKASFIAGALYIYLAPFTDSIDINYGAWMITPYIWSACALWALLDPVGREEHGTQSSAGSPYLSINQKFLLFGVCGLCIAMSALMKRQGAAIFPLAIWFLLRERAQRSTLFLAFGGGLLIGFSLIFTYYALRGELWESAGHFFFSKSGWSYLSNDLISKGTTELNQSNIGSARLPRLWDGIVGLAYHVPLSGGLALITLLPHRRSNYKAQIQSKTILLWCLFGLSFLGAALGLRFFKGYYLQVLPSLLWIGVNPKFWKGLCETLCEGLGIYVVDRHEASRERSVEEHDPLSRTELDDVKGRPLKKLIMSLLIIGLLSSLLVPATYSSWEHLTQTRAMRSGPLYLPARQIKEICDGIRVQSDQSSPQTTHGLEGITLWVWGRWAWPAYYFLEAKSTTRFFKNLGVLTTQLNNTWNPQRASSPTRFDPNTPWKQAISELKFKSPQWIIIAKNESISGFKELKHLLELKYKRQSYKDLKVSSAPHRVLFEVYQLK